MYPTKSAAIFRTMQCPHHLCKVVAVSHLPVVPSHVTNILTRICIIHLDGVPISGSKKLTPVAESTLSAGANRQLLVSSQIIH